MFGWGDGEEGRRRELVAVVGWEGCDLVSWMQRARQAVS